MSVEDTISVQKESVVEAETPGFDIFGEDFEAMKMERDSLKVDNASLKVKIESVEKSNGVLQDERRKIQEKNLSLQKQLSERAHDIQNLTQDNSKLVSFQL